MPAGWERLAHVTLGSSNANITTGTITAKKHLYMVGYIIKTGSGTEVTMRYNNDTGNNYGRSRSGNGASDGSADTGQSRIDLVGGESTPTYFTMHVINEADEEKIGICEMVRNSASGAGTAPSRTENVNKWYNASAQITEIDLHSISSTFAAGSTFTVWGADDAALVYPNLSNGTIFEESDTGKHQMFDGSQTWNEME